MGSMCVATRVPIQGSECSGPVSKVPLTFAWPPLERPRGHVAAGPDANASAGFEGACALGAGEQTSCPIREHEVALHRDLLTLVQARVLQDHAERGVDGAMRRVELFTQASAPAR